MDGKLITLGGRIAPKDVASGPDTLGKVSAGLGVQGGGSRFHEGVRNDNPWTKARGVATATAALSGELLSGAAAGAWGGPACAAAGLTVALVAWGMSTMFDPFDMSEFDIARPAI